MFALKRFVRKGIYDGAEDILRRYLGVEPLGFFDRFITLFDRDYLSFDINHVFEYEGTLLMIAAAHSDPKMLDLLVRYGADLNVINPTNRCNALDYALGGCGETPNRNAIYYLALKGINLNQFNASGQTPLMLAIHLGYLDLFTFLLTLREVPDQPFFVSPEYESIKRGPKFLGADPHAISPCGDTALIVAAKTGSFEAARLLLREGVHIDAGFRHNRALMWAQRNGHSRVYELLQPADNILEVAAKGYLSFITESMLNPEIVDDEGNNALHLAITYGRNPLMIDYLLSLKIFNRPNKLRVTPLDLLVRDYYAENSLFTRHHGELLLRNPMIVMQILRCDKQSLMSCIPKDICDLTNVFMC